MRKKKETIFPELREQVLERDHHTCRYCGSTDGPFQIDHVYPESKGGSTTLENLVTACYSCNVRKSYKLGIWPNPIVKPSPPPTREIRITYGSAVTMLGASLSLLTVYPGAAYEVFHLPTETVMYAFDLIVIGVLLSWLDI